MRIRALVFGSREPWWPSGLCSIEPEVETEVPPVGGGVVPPVPPVVPVAPVLGRGGEIPPERVSEIKRAEAAKERRTVLIEEYGTADEAEIAKIKDQRKKDADELIAKRKADEDKRQAEMTESEKLKEQLRVQGLELEAEKSKTKTTAQRLEEEKQDRIITGHASKHFATKYVKAAKVEFAEYVEGLTKAQLAELTPEKIDKWFAKYAKENPALALPPPTVTKTAEEIEADRVAAAAGRKPAIPPKRVGGVRPPIVAKPPAGGAPTKHPRDMTPQEYKAHLKKLGRTPAY